MKHLASMLRALVLYYAFSNDSSQNFTAISKDIPNQMKPIDLMIIYLGIYSINYTPIHGISLMKKELVFLVLKELMKKIILEYLISNSIK